VNIADQYFENEKDLKMHIADQPIAKQPEQPVQPVFIDDLVAETALAIVDLTKIVSYLASTKTLPVSVEAASLRLHDFVKRIQS
jgi:hypothetical protein